MIEPSQNDQDCIPSGSVKQELWAITKQINSIRKNKEVEKTFTLGFRVSKRRGSLQALLEEVEKTFTSLPKLPGWKSCFFLIIIVILSCRTKKWKKHLLRINVFSPLLMAKMALKQPDAFKEVEKTFTYNGRIYTKKPQNALFSPKKWKKHLPGRLPAPKWTKNSR